MIGDFSLKLAILMIDVELQVVHNVFLFTNHLVPPKGKFRPFGIHQPVSVITLKKSIFYTSEVCIFDLSWFLLCLRSPE